MFFVLLIMAQGACSSNNNNTGRGNRNEAVRLDVDIGNAVDGEGDRAYPHVSYLMTLQGAALEGNNERHLKEFEKKFVSAKHII